MPTTLERNATPIAAAHPPRLMDRVRESMRVAHYALRTERNYCHWILDYIRHHGRRHPGEMGAAEVEAYLTHLATQRDVSASTHTAVVASHQDEQEASGDEGDPAFISHTDLGFTSMTEYALHIIDGSFGVSTRQIARRVGVSTRAVWGLLKTHLKAGRVEFSGGFWQSNPLFVRPEILRAVDLLRAEGWSLTPPSRTLGGGE